MGEDENKPIGKILVPIRVDGERTPPRIYDLLMSKGRYLLMLETIQHPTHGQGLRTLVLDTEHVRQPSAPGAPWTYQIPIDAKTKPESGLQ
ncbi:hypothetical protein [Alcaligenes faecalis]|uniref:hypothetical protein n=1 Tax=Alcaligenes faecalis TaxID=511 RepID=UPI00129330C4|nr:hypothetical protein [Alcaligenes faecalis]